MKPKSDTLVPLLFHSSLQLHLSDLLALYECMSTSLLLNFTIHVDGVRAYTLTLNDFKSGLESLYLRNQYSS